MKGQQAFGKVTHALMREQYTYRPGPPGAVYIYIFFFHFTGGGTSVVVVGGGVLFQKITLASLFSRFNKKHAEGFNHLFGLKIHALPDRRRDAATCKFGPVATTPLLVLVSN